MILAAKCLQLKEKEKSLLTEYTYQRLKENKVGLFDTIKKKKFQNICYKMSAADTHSEKKLLKADRKLLQRLFNAASSGRSVQKADIFFKNVLSSVPLSLAKLVEK